ncbi:cell surface protein [Podospora australis]|uniref:Cell surface protein n=1 Tax=Podospora australis TaxID=1536484 RepID=A0AAN6WZZ5_9PEZI|nr:cell surface protein [Podospora australis]
MLFIVTLALTILPLVSAHGKLVSLTGDAGGNGTALAIRGAIVPGTGPNSKTEVDTTVFSKTSILSDGLGKTTGSGKNKINMIIEAMALSGTTLPQISTTQGSAISGIFHIVTTDGAGPLSAVLDPTATGKFSTGIPLTVITQIPGDKGNIAAPKKQQKQQRSVLGRAVDTLLAKRGGAANVNQSFPFKFSVPAGTVCNGTVAGLTGVCLVKIANSNKAGPFGGVAFVQTAGAAAGSAGGANSDKSSEIGVQVGVWLRMVYIFKLNVTVQKSNGRGTVADIRALMSTSYDVSAQVSH